MNSKPQTAAELFRKPGTWTQGHYRLDLDGFACSPKNATKFCLVGGIAQVYCEGNVKSWSTIGPLLDKVTDVLCNKGHFESITGWNDKPGRTQEEVLALVEEAGI